MSAQVMRCRLFDDHSKVRVRPAPKVRGRTRTAQWVRSAWVLIFIATTHWPAIVPTVVDCTDCTLAPLSNEVWPDLPLDFLNPWLQGGSDGQR